MNTNERNTDQYRRMTETSLSELLVRLSIPAILSMLVTSIYNMVDTAFVGQLGTSASGAVGIVFSLMAILQAVGFMFGQGSGAIISRSLGKKDIEKASEVASTGFFLSFFIGIILACVSMFFLDQLVLTLGSTETIAPYAKTYCFYIILAAPFMMSSFVLNNILRFEGRAALGMIGMMAGGFLNMIGDPILMFGLNMGIAGAGLSTALSQIISFCILLSMFIRRKTQIRLSPGLISVRPALIGDIAATGLPSLIRQMLVSIATMILNIQAAKYGDAAVSAMSIVSRIGMFIFSFGLGIGQGFQPICGFNYGAGKYGRVRKAFRLTSSAASGVVAFISIIVIVFSGMLIRVFRDDPEVIRIGTRALRLYSVSIIFVPFGMVTEMMFQSTGHKIGAAVMSTLRSGMIFIPLLLFLGYFRGLAGIQEAQPLAYVLSIIPAIIMAVWFFRKLPREEEK